MEKVEQSESDLITLIPCLPFRNGDASRKKKRKKEETDVCCKLADSKKWRKRAANVCNCLRETAGWIDTDMYIYIWNFIQLCPLWRVTSFSCISFPICDEVSPPSESQVYCVPFPRAFCDSQYAERRIPLKGVRACLGVPLTSSTTFFFFLLFFLNLIEPRCASGWNRQSTPSLLKFPLVRELSEGRRTC